MTVQPLSRHCVLQPEVLSLLDGPARRTGCVLHSTDTKITTAVTSTATTCCHNATFSGLMPCWGAIRAYCLPALHEQSSNFGRFLNLGSL